jgi:hypothetical protein
MPRHREQLAKDLLASSILGLLHLLSDSLRPQPFRGESRELMEFTCDVTGELRNVRRYLPANEVFPWRFPGRVL